MAYNTPKTNWNASDIPNPDDFNRIEGNTEDNHNRLDGHDDDISNNASDILSNASEVNKIKDGTTKVPSAENADNANDAEKINGITLTIAKEGSASISANGETTIEVSSPSPILVSYQPTNGFVSYEIRHTGGVVVGDPHLIEVKFVNKSSSSVTVEYRIIEVE